MIIDYDVIVIGSGIAGLSCAIFLREKGFKVMVLTKESDPVLSNSYYAQGGIVAWRESDTPELIEEDILAAGDHYNNLDAVRELARQAPALVFEFLINKICVNFSRSKNQSLDYTEEAAHSVRRILHYSDRTGEEIMNKLYSYAVNQQIEIRTNYTAVDLITNNHHARDCQELYKPRRVMGVYALNNGSGEVERLLSRYVVLASGGVGDLYLHTTNPSLATGDGIAMAWRAGAAIINAEMVQFHPTCLFHRDIKRFLISESLRGEGARLKTPDMREFMGNYTNMRDLAPRDVVTRAIFSEMNRLGVEYLLLDLAGHYTGTLPIPERFPKIYQTCLQGGIDITRDPIPIVPAAHYFCGGVKADLNGYTSIRNLYAIGEVSCTGLHGANRLASTSLLEGLWWACKSADHILLHPDELVEPPWHSIPEWTPPPRSEDFDPLLIQQDLKVIRLTLWNYAGIVRTRKGLERALSDLNFYEHRIFKFYREAKLTRSIIELRNAVICARLIVEAALHNRRSIGCHYLGDNP